MVRLPRPSKKQEHSGSQQGALDGEEVLADEV